MCDAMWRQRGTYDPEHKSTRHAYVHRMNSDWSRVNIPTFAGAWISDNNKMCATIGSGAAVGNYTVDIRARLCLRLQ